MHNPAMLKRLKKTAFWGGFILLVLTGIALLMDKTGTGIACPFHTLTHLNCPGCGNTRAVLACLHLDFRKALEYNYFFPAEFLYILWVASASCMAYIRTGEKTLKTPPAVINIIFLFCLILWLILRNILHV